MEKPRRGRPPKLTAKQRARISELLKDPSVRTAAVADAYDVSVWTIQQLLPDERRVPGRKHANRARDLTGRVFGKRTVLSKSDRTSPTRNAYWVCQCVCGRVDDVRGDYLIAGHSQQCVPCRQKESIGQPKGKRFSW